MMLLILERVLTAITRFVAGVATWVLLRLPPIGLETADNEDSKVIFITVYIGTGKKLPTTLLSTVSDRSSSIDS